MIVIGTGLLLRAQGELAELRLEETRALLDVGEVVDVVTVRGVRITQFQDGDKRHVVLEFPAGLGDVELKWNTFGVDRDFPLWVTEKERPCTIRLTFQPHRDDLKIWSKVTTLEREQESVGLLTHLSPVASHWNEFTVRLGGEPQGETGEIETLCDIVGPRELLPDDLWMTEGANKVLFRLRIGAEEAFSAEAARQATP
ncbi:hypothetical protein [Blastopirellula marina]|uniref:hypothetical protein n=1 Tax=Blastopirellula marina TaxID=124 RepID=UPI0011B09D21|nr:hypothetical protein [Blastopirellula marina]